MGLEVFSLTGTRLERRVLRIVCFAMELWTTPIFFSCGRWDGVRQQLYLNTGDLSPDNIVEERLRTADRWNRVAHYVRALLVAKKIELDRWRSRMAGGSLN